MTLEHISKNRIKLVVDDVILMSGWSGPDSAAVDTQNTHMPAKLVFEFESELGNGVDICPHPICCAK